MDFISTKGMTNETAPEAKVLVQYLEPFFGSYAVEYTIAYFDNPNDYEDPNDGEGWWHHNTGNPLKVLAYCPLPAPMENPYGNMTQQEFFMKHGEFPNLGSVGM